MTRAYSSALRSERAAANRRAVIDTATEMFCEIGWVATTMAGVAKAAGLTRQTVYQQFDAKLTLLDACIDNALTHGDGGAVRGMPTYRAMGVGTFDERLTAGAAWLRAAHERSARIQNVLDQAAVTDAEAADRLHVREQQRWDEVAHALSLILGDTTVSPARNDSIVDSVWLLASRRTWLMLVEGRGWSPQQWEDWFRAQVAATLRRQ
ncbi:helix-turn-helix domain-containing protein [Gordonia sp. CPCC 205515]|uniref:TetR/AcrR family transcriptional regulator n=1 Tax=Gordonia sp. CPCC 205515 TaxID=3140791 RepID=UPI003AF3A19C